MEINYTKRQLTGVLIVLESPDVLSLISLALSLFHSCIEYTVVGYLRFRQSILMTVTSLSAFVESKQNGIDLFMIQPKTICISTFSYILSLLKHVKIHLTILMSCIYSHGIRGCVYTTLCIVIPCKTICL